MPQRIQKVKAFVLALSVSFTANCWAIHEVSFFRALEARGTAAEMEGDLDAALGCYVQGMALNPAFYDTRFADDRRLEQRVRERRLPPPGRSFNWSAPVGSSVYVYAEEGMGDTIQFSRYIPELVARGYQVVFRPQKPLASLMAQLLGTSVLIDVETPEQELDYDYYLPLLSMPQLCFAGVDGIPGKAGYLASGGREVHEGIGIVWQGFPGRENDKRRSVPLAKLARLGELVQLNSLQVGFGSEQLMGVEGIVDLGSTFADFADTAAAIEGLDLVIAVDTSVAHLSGALGVETWILIPYEPDWRWFRHGDSSPFYDTVRLFRQSEPDCSCRGASGDGVRSVEPADARSATSARAQMPWSRSAAGQMPGSPQAGHANSCCAATDNWDEVIDRVWAALQERVSNSSESESTSLTSSEATLS